MAWMIHLTISIVRNEADVLNVQISWPRAFADSLFEIHPALDKSSFNPLTVDLNCRQCAAIITSKN